MVICIVAGAPKQYLPSLAKYDKEGVSWVGADRGVLHLLQQGIKPEKAFGDFDSVTGEELAWIKSQMSDVDVYPCEKDETDLELALIWAIEQQPTEILLFGATGGRFDHTLGNVQLLVRGLENKVEIKMVDDKNLIMIKKPGEYKMVKQGEYPYTSFLPLTREVSGIFLDGFKYSLSNGKISWGSTLCMSNELINGIGTYSFLEGILIVVRSKD